MLNNILPKRGEQYNARNMEKFSFLQGVGLFAVMPIFTIYLLAMGLSFTTYLAIQAWFSLVILAAELPTGIFADIYGRKTSIAIGAFVSGLGFLAYFFGGNALEFALAETLIGLGMSFRSGADRALVYDSMKGSKRRVATKYFGRIGAASVLGGMIGSLASSALVGPFGMRTLFLVTFALLAAVGVLEWIYLVEPKRKNSVEKTVIGVYCHMKSSVGFIAKRTKLLAVIAAVILLGEAGRIAFHFFQPYWQNSGIGAEYFGAVYFFLMAASYIGAKKAESLEKTFGPVYAIGFLGMIYSAAFLAMGFFGGALVALVVPLFIEFSYGALDPVYSAYLNKFIPSARRATILSLESFLSNGFYVIFAPLVGIVADKYSLSVALVVLGIAAAVSATMSSANQKNSVRNRPPGRGHVPLAGT